MNTKTTEINLIDLLYYILKRVWVVLLVTFSFAAAALIFCKFFIVPEYTASARVYVLNRSSEDSLAYSDLQSSEKLTSDFEVLITGRNITSVVIENLHLNMSHSELVNEISVTSPNDTRVLQISVTDKDPQLAANIANNILGVAGEQIVPIMGIDALNVVYEADVPTAPSSPNTKQNVFLAAALGLFLTLIVFVIRFAMDDTIRSEDDVSKYLNLSTMGVIPKDNEAADINYHSKQSKGGHVRKRG